MTTRRASRQTGLPATPLSRFRGTGGFASPPHDGFALRFQRRGMPCRRHTAAECSQRSRTPSRAGRKCLDLTTCGFGYTHSAQERPRGCRVPLRVDRTARVFWWPAVLACNSSLDRWSALSHPDDRFAGGSCCRSGSKVAVAPRSDSIRKPQRPLNRPEARLFAQWIHAPRFRAIRALWRRCRNARRVRCACRLPPALWPRAIHSGDALAHASFHSRGALGSRSRPLARAATGARRRPPS